MKKSKNARPLVPKIRFPEFQKSGEWVSSPLGAVCGMQAGKFVAAAEIFVESGAELFPCYGGNGLRGYTKTYTHSGRYSLIGRQGSLCGNVTFVDGLFHATEHAVVATPKVGIHTEWLFYELDLLNLNRFATGQALPGLSVDILNRVECAIPTDEAEQKKISECLSSFDSIVRLEEENLAALKVHKRGLMQQLFPVEGECLPRLRFPEFEKDGEWARTTIGEVGSFYYGKGAPKWSLEDGAPTPCIRYGELYTKFESIISETYSRTNVDPENLRFSKGGEILVPRVGEKPEDFGRCCCYLPLKGIAIGEMISVFETSQNPLFYTYYFKNLYRQFARVVEGQNVKNLYYAVLEPLSICLPSLPEQNKIADTLASLDAIIDAQSQKVDTLNIQKKALMQHLFPKIGQLES